MEIKTIASDSRESFNELFALVQLKQYRPLICQRKGDFKEIYQLLGNDSETVGIVDQKEILASVSFIKLITDQSVFFVTDLIKNPKCHQFASLRLIRHFLDKRKLWRHPFCLTFVEEHLNTLESLIAKAIKNYHFKIREELIYCHLFNVAGTPQAIETTTTGVVEETIDGFNCQFFTDRSWRSYVLNNDFFFRAYVRISGDIRPKALTYKKIIESGKKYALKSGCNIFFILTDQELDLGHDYLHVKRKIELWNGELGPHVDLTASGILI